MKIGIIGNIAGNANALMDVDRKFDELGVVERIAAGKIVGMYPYIDECVELLQRKKYSAIKLSVDAEFSESCEFDGWSNDSLISALRFARAGFCSSTSLKYLKSLPETLNGDRYCVVGLLLGTRSIYDQSDARIGLDYWRKQIVFHNAALHVGVWNEELIYGELTEGINRLDSRQRVLISIGGAGSLIQGSVNDRVPSALVYDDEAFSLQLFRPICNLGEILRHLEHVGYPSGALDLLRRREYRLWIR